MTREEAREILGASRPNGQDDLDPLIAEALQFEQLDPEQKSWLEKERALDRALFAKLSSFPVPKELKDQILCRPPVVQAPFKKAFFWFSIAAVLMVMLGLSWFRTSPEGPHSVAFENYHRQIVTFASDFWTLPHHSSDLKNIQVWLAQSDSPANFKIPSKFDALVALGCRSLEVEGNKVSLICFRLLDGKSEAHLFVVDRASIENVPPEMAPFFMNKAGWTTASWSDSKHVFILASPVGLDMVKELL